MFRFIKNCLQYNEKYRSKLVPKVLFPMHDWNLRVRLRLSRKSTYSRVRLRLTRESNFTRVRLRLTRENTSPHGKSLLSVLVLKYTISSYCLESNAFSTHINIAESNCFPIPSLVHGKISCLVHGKVVSKFGRCQR